MLRDEVNSIALEKFKTVNPALSYKKGARASSGDLSLTAADDAYTVRMEVTVTVGMRSVPETVGAGVLSLM